MYFGSDYFNSYFDKNKKIDGWGHQTCAFTQFRYRLTKKILKSNLNFDTSLSIIDVGCGLGDFLRILQKDCTKDTNFLGCDISDNAINIATTMEENNNLKFRVDKLPDLDSINNKYDLVLCLETIFYLEKKEIVFRALKRIRQITKKEGYLCISLPTRQNIIDYRVFEIMLKDMYEFKKFRVYNLFKEFSLDNKVFSIFIPIYDYIMNIINLDIGLTNIIYLARIKDY